MHTTHYEVWQPARRAPRAAEVLKRILLSYNGPQEFLLAR